MTREMAKCIIFIEKRWEKNVDTRACEELCLKLTGLLQQDSRELSRSLRGDILDAYARLVQTEVDSLREIRKRLTQLTDKE